MKSFLITNVIGSQFFYTKKALGFYIGNSGIVVEFCDGSNDLLVNKFLHREDGPAIVWDDLECSWYWHGEKIDVNSQEEFELWKRFRNFQ